MFLIFVIILIIINNMTITIIYDSIQLVSLKWRGILLDLATCQLVVFKSVKLFLYFTRSCVEVHALVILLWRLDFYIADIKFAVEVLSFESVLFDSLLISNLRHCFARSFSLSIRKKQKNFFVGIKFRCLNGKKRSPRLQTTLR